jgi:hypothetical protein
MRTRVARVHISRPAPFSLLSTRARRRESAAVEQEAQSPGDGRGPEEADGREAGGAAPLQAARQVPVYQRGRGEGR